MLSDSGCSTDRGCWYGTKAKAEVEGKAQKLHWREGKCGGTEMVGGRMAGSSYNYGLQLWQGLEPFHRSGLHTHVLLLPIYDSKTWGFFLPLNDMGGDLKIE